MKIELKLIVLIGSAKTDPIQFKRVFEEGLLNDNSMKPDMITHIIQKQLFCATDVCV